MNKWIQGDCLRVLPVLSPATTLFADPPDNIGLGYNEFDDRRADQDYVDWLEQCVRMFADHADIVWLSFNAKWTFALGRIFESFLVDHPDWEGKPCVQAFTFGQHNHRDLGNNHRPLWRLKHRDAPLYPDQIRVPSWRQANGDKRADPRGRVPGDVFDFTRVVGNSKQRRTWHPTQLNEGLVERCLLLSTLPGQRVIDPFGGTGTTLRVCHRLGRPCTLIEVDGSYCAKVAEENGLEAQANSNPPLWLSKCADKRDLEQLV
jgi:site-specific DNA-methyltransferase (adenine-specific)